jgi:hypothetical protein
MIDSKQQFLEIHLEEQQQPFWRAALANSLTGYFGSMQYRFVARSSADPEVCVAGARFALPRYLDPDDVDDVTGSVAIARERLDELEARLFDEGWTVTGTSGHHWWSRTYAREAPVQPR